MITWKGCIGESAIFFTLYTKQAPLIEAYGGDVEVGCQGEDLD